MNKLAIVLLSLCVIGTSCTKKVKVPLSYSVEADHAQEINDIYILDSETTVYPVVVKFLTGYDRDSVKLTVQGLPAGITVTPDSFGAIPTFTQNLSFTTHKMPVGSYPFTITSTAPGSLSRTINANILVIPNDCSKLFLGDATATNSCSGRDYPYTVTYNGTNKKNEEYIVNFGGYGVHTTTYIALDCEHGYVYIPRQGIGNGVVVEGSGTFNLHRMVITYNAENIPGGGSETCTATIVK